MWYLSYAEALALLIYMMELKAAVICFTTHTAL